VGVEEQVGMAARKDRGERYVEEEIVARKERGCYGLEV